MSCSRRNQLHTICTPPHYKNLMMLKAALSAYGGRVQILRRGFASSGVKRAKPIRVKKSEARRVVPEAPKPTDALTEAPAPPPPANPFVQSERPPQTFGGVMKESFVWGMGMAVAFSVVGIVFSSMEETTSPGEFDCSLVIPAESQCEREN